MRSIKRYSFEGDASGEMESGITVAYSARQAKELAEAYGYRNVRVKLLNKKRKRRRKR